jgi:hypothetical protein
MLELLDQILIRKLAFNTELETALNITLNKSDRPGILCFLPWNTSYALGARLGLVNKQFSVCVQLPSALICSQPTQTENAMKGLIRHVEDLLKERRLSPAVVVGYSLGTYPATYIANKLRTRLVSIASADRGDLMFWESQAVMTLKRRAILNGFNLADYTKALAGFHPIENLDYISKRSLFIFGQTDPFIPRARSNALVQALKSRSTLFDVRRVRGGHIRTLLRGAAYLTKYLGSILDDGSFTHSNISPTKTVP